MNPSTPRRTGARTLVAFHAHPDDESLLTAGTMAKAAAEGHRVILVVATAGEVGEADAAYGPRGPAPEGLGATRLAELHEAAGILGVDRVEVLGYRDSGSGDHRPPGEGPCFVEVDIDEAAHRLATILIEEDADVVTTYDRNGGYGHPDHRHVHAVGRRAAELAGTPVLLEATFNRDLLQVGVGMVASMGYQLPPGFHPSSFDEWFTPAGELTHAIDVSEHLPAKRAAMQAHRSQATSGQPEGDVRSMALFLSLPEDWYRMAFATEWYVQPGHPPGETATDVFATLTTG
jgi:LmbE family N-acetylglucosaminyl deacetylase